MTHRGPFQPLQFCEESRTVKVQLLANNSHDERKPDKPAEVVSLTTRHKHGLKCCS